MGYNLWSHKEPDVAEQLGMHAYTHIPVVAYGHRSTFPTRAGRNKRQHIGEFGRIVVNFYFFPCGGNAYFCRVK